MNSSKSLKEKVLKGSFYLALRQLLASGLSLVSLLVDCSRWGSNDYGSVILGQAFTFLSIFLNTSL